MASKKSLQRMLIALFSLLAFLIVLSLGVDLGLEGTDDRALEVVTELHPDYNPWFS